MGSPLERCDLRLSFRFCTYIYTFTDTYSHMLHIFTQKTERKGEKEERETERETEPKKDMGEGKQGGRG